MRWRWSLAAGCLVGLPAGAQGDWPDAVPNGQVHGCDTCHDELPALNAFGDDVVEHLDDDGVAWQLVFALDSDGDGLENGVELGDPCGDWVPGADPSYDDVSHPGDPDSALDAPPETSCVDTDTGGTPEPEDTSAPPTDAEPDDEAYTGCLYASAGVPPAAWWLALAPLLLLRRRPIGRA